ncbi:hypothetical protein ANCDUO_15542 [Ancylostoma duodenale]|uniref:MATH domain-containing protein n=1 Tax=Ancylostoma duodenale TaxID=51022 RepID=A0A0C2CDA5_9BILA|nr:hypothetical protein ANCDUO_15542 [Ancylostoma duodenale]
MHERMREDYPRKGDGCTFDRVPEEANEMHLLQYAHQDTKHGEALEELPHPSAGRKRIHRYSLRRTDEKDRGKYLAVYVTLVRGKYDPLLDWPFDHVVCITLLDQNPEAGKRCDISYWVDPKKIKEKTEFLQRPLTDKNGSFGAQTFCRLAVMENYIKDDTMFLQVEIKVVNEPEELPAIALMNGQLPPRGAKPPATPDTHSVMDLSIATKTPADDNGRLPTAMKVPDGRGSRPPSAQMILESRPSLAQLPPQPIMPDGLQPVNAPTARVHTPKSGRNVVAPVPQSAPIVVSEKLEIPEAVTVERPRSKA